MLLVPFGTGVRAQLPWKNLPAQNVTIHVTYYVLLSAGSHIAFSHIRTDEHLDTFYKKGKIKASKMSPTNTPNL